MAAKIKESVNARSPVSQLAGWARQGIDSFVAAQKILLDLTAQQNALVIGMLRENLSKPLLWPGEAIATIADKGVQNISAAGKILLDLAGDGTELVVDRVKEAVPLPMPASYRGKRVAPPPGNFARPAEAFAGSRCRADA